MRSDAFKSTTRTRWSPGRLTLSWLLVVAAVAAPSYAQSVLGTLRGTVTDPQGKLVAGATVLITDEASGVPRTVATDADGRYEATNLRPGSYRVEIVTTSFKKVERPGVVVRTGGATLVDVKLELGGSGGNRHGLRRADEQHRAGEPVGQRRPRRAAAARPAAQRPRHDGLPAAQPQRAGGSDDIQFLGGRTYGVSYVQDGQASTNAIFGTVGNSAPGLDAIGEIQVLSNSYSAEYGGLAGVVVTTKRGGNSHRGSAFYDFNSDGLNALTYNQKQAGAERGDPNSDTHAHRWGASFGGPLIENKTFFFANYEGSNQKEIYGGGRANVPDPGHAQRRLLGRQLRDQRPAHGPALPRQRDPGEPHRPDRAEDAELLLPAAQPGDALERHGRLPGVRARDAQPRARRPAASTTRPRARTRCSCAAATSTATRAASSSRPATRSRTSASATPRSTRPRSSPAGRGSFRPPASTSSASATTTTRASGRASMRSVK